VVFRAPCIMVSPGSASCAVVEERCSGCGACVTRLGCPALSQGAPGKAAAIDPALCTGCGLCRFVCAFDAISQAVSKGEKG
jgi:indolepyruvate ferredoxin oxidoreductase alpha subunit